MQRFGKVLRLREGAEDEYERHHAQVWPEVLAAIQRSGIRSFNIYRYGRWLFAYMELPDDATLEEVGRKIAADPRSVQWEELMHRFQEPLPESKGLNWWVDMKEIFHYEARS